MIMKYFGPLNQELQRWFTCRYSLSTTVISFQKRKVLGIKRKSRIVKRNKENKNDARSYKKKKTRKLLKCQSCFCALISVTITFRSKFELELIHNLLK